MGVSHWPSPFPVPVFSFRLAHGRRRIVIKEDLAAEDRKRMAAVPVSSLSGPGPPPCTTQQHGCSSSPAKQQGSSSISSTVLVGGRGEAWPPVVGLAPAIGGHAASVSRPRASSCNGPLKSTITLTITSLTLSLVGRDRRKKTG